MGFDAGEQIFQVRTANFGDWHPPLMSAYWWLLEVVVRGPFLMLVLQSGLFLWGLHQILRVRLGERAAAWAAAGILLFPPVFTPMAAVWKDAQMVGFLVAGIALALRPSWRARAGAIVLWFFAAGVRDNGAIALPFLVLWATAVWGYASVTRVAVAAALTAAIATAAFGVNRALARRTEYPWYRSVALMDITGTIRFADPISDHELRGALDGTGYIADIDLQRVARAGYSPRAWFENTVDGKSLFAEPHDDAARASIRRAWWTLVREHPGAYLRHRWAVMQEVLGLSGAPTWEPVPQSRAGTKRQWVRVEHNFSPSWLQRHLGTAYRDGLGDGPLYRPWMYVVIAVVLLVDAVRRRDRIVVALLAGALLYEVSFFVGAAAPDFRYSHWLVICTCLAVVLATKARLAVLPSGSGPCSSRS